MATVSPPAPPAPPAPLPPPAPPGPRPPAPSAATLVTSSIMPALPTFTTMNVPRLAKPQSFDIDAINMLIGALDYAITREQVKTGTATIDAESAAKLETNKKIKEQLEAIKTKTAEATEAAGEDKVAGWCLAIGLLVGAALACIALFFTAGATAPLVILAVVGAVMAIQEITNMSLKEEGTQYTACTGETKQLDVSFNGMIDAIVDRQLVDESIVVVHQDPATGDWLDKDNKKVDKSEHSPLTLYFTEDELEDWKMGWAITTTLLITVAMMVTGYGAMKGWGAINKIAEGANKTAKHTSSTTERVMEAGSIIADLEAASATIYKGSVGIRLANINSDSDRARAYKAYFDNMIKEISQRIGLANDAIQTIVERMNEIFDAMSRSVAEASNNYQQSAEAIGFNPQGA